jgi:hypothetical protein
MDKRISECINQRMDGWINKLMYKSKDRQMDKWMNQGMLHISCPEICLRAVNGPLMTSIHSY